MTLEKQLPVAGKIYCHKRLSPTLKRVQAEIERKSLEDEIRTFECFSPRHKMHDPKSLS